MSAIELCISEPVEIKLWSGTETVHGHRYQEFAVHRLASEGMFDPWRISHLPSGHVAGKEFPTLEQAAAAMIEIAKLRNDWAVVQQDDLSARLRAQVIEVVERHGGFVPVGPRPYKVGLNGYSVERLN